MTSRRGLGDIRVHPFEDRLQRLPVVSSHVNHRSVAYGHHRRFLSRHIRSLEARRFHGDDSFHQIRPLLGRYPREDSTIPVSDQNRRADVVEKNRAPRAPNVLRDRVVPHRLSHRRDELRHRRIARVASARPLRTRDALRDAFESRRFPIEQAVEKGVIRIAALPGPVDNVDLVALFNEHRGPTAAAIGRADPVRTLAVAAVNQDDRIGMAHLRGNPVFHIHLHAVANGAACEQGVFDAIPVVAPLGDIEHGARVSGCRRLRPELGSQRACREYSKIAPGES